jgi:hypothetical protein
MKWTNKGKEFSNFAQNWKNVKEFSVFGFGQKCKVFMDAIHNDFTILKYYDNDRSKVGQTLYGTSVLPAKKIEGKKDKILLAASQYQEIAHQLKGYGLVEDVDFCDIKKFLSMYYWVNHREVHIPEVHIALTTKCTLNCKHCNMFIPHYKSEISHIDFSELIDNTKSFFNFTDRVYLFQILGGEPFLYTKLEDYIEFLGENFRKKIVELNIVTNGTVLPNERSISLIKKYDIVVIISDYSNLEKFAAIFSKVEKKLRYSNVRILKTASSGKWLDFGFPHKPLNIPEDELVEHMHDCNPVFRGLNNGKFYWCHLVWSAVRSGLLAENKSDYLDLTALDPRNPEDKLMLIEYNLGYMENGYVSLCRFCAGCAKSNTMFVDPAIQV